MTVTKGKGHPALSKKEFSLILRYEKSRIKLMKASPGNFPHHFAGNEGKVNGIIHSPSDTFFREFESTLFNIEGVGQAHAHHINYLGIGFMSAHYGLDQTTTNFLINSWNATQGYLTVSGHQFADIPESRRWAEKGRSLFNEEK